MTSTVLDEPAVYTRGVHHTALTSTEYPQTLPYGLPKRTWAWVMAPPSPVERQTGLESFHHTLEVGVPPPLN